MGNGIKATLKGNSSARHKQDTLQVRRPEEARSLCQIVGAWTNGQAWERGGGQDEKLNFSRKADKNLLTEKKKTEGNNIKDDCHVPSSDG